MAVVDFTVLNREPYADGISFSDTGSYEQVDGVLNFAVDPVHISNRMIVDLDKAPRNPEGRVEFKADFSVVMPHDPDRANGRALVELPNRGRRRIVPVFNRAPASAPVARVAHPGDGFLFNKGYTVASIGWQWDVMRTDSMMGLEPPYAEGITGQTIVEIRVNDRRTTYQLSDRGIHDPLPVIDMYDPDARLLVREYEDDEDSLVSREAWSFAQETGSGVIPSRTHIYMKDGFEPGKIYYVIYQTDRAPIAGTGLLALRDVAPYLRAPSHMNPTPGNFRAVYAWGVSQTGRFLRHFMHLGLNSTEGGEMAYDGVLPHVAGARRGAFNHRFAQPSNQSTPIWGHVFPFADQPTSDVLTEESGGLLDLLRIGNAVPKIIYTNSSAEYWRGDGVLAHIDTSGGSDIQEAPESRSYLFASTQHGPGYLGQDRFNADNSGVRHELNITDYSPLLRAALVNLDRWVMDDVEPPASQHPRLSDGSAVEKAEVLATFRDIPDFVVPDVDRLFYLRTVDLGTRSEEGVGEYPAKEGEYYPSHVSAVDSDGNETGGIRLPEIAVPVGTHTGWNPRAPETGSPEQMVPMTGSTAFFSVTRLQRNQNGDPRPSIEERYEDRDDYLTRVRAVAEQLVSDRYALEEDIDLMVSNASDRYDAAVEVNSKLDQ
ncbi:MAG: alpha/beta hydrolase domain-containing protein [Dehalococcoidia bacterium]